MVRKISLSIVLCMLVASIFAEDAKKTSARPLANVSRLSVVIDYHDAVIKGYSSSDYAEMEKNWEEGKKEIKAKQVKVEVKEIRFGPQTDDHDYNFKLKHAQEFLKEGSKVKAYVFFRGRAIVYKEQGELLLARFCQDLEEYGKPDRVPTLEGKRMIVFLTPKQKK